MSAYEIAGLTLCALMLAWLALDARAAAKRKAFRAHVDQALAAHAADVRKRGLDANASGHRWQG
jgi:hypothetical protein